MSALICCFCGRSELSSDQDPACELRPYGPGGALICFPCATRPENQAAAERQFIEQFNAASKTSGGVAVLTKDGPKPIGDVDMKDGYGLAVAVKAAREPSDRKVEDDQDEG